MTNIKTRTYFITVALKFPCTLHSTMRRRMARLDYLFKDESAQCTDKASRGTVAVRGTARKPHYSGVIISLNSQPRTNVYLIIAM
jgi:hypothetical protein